MAEERNKRVETRIGNYTYYGAKFKDPELQQLILEWQKFDYNKFSGPEEQMEWSIMEVLLLEDFDLSYVSTSYIEYPSFPYDDMDEAKKLVAAVKEAKSLLQGFQLPERRSGESLRLYQARVADQLEAHLASKMDKVDAALSGDFYLSRCIKDPPAGYEE